MIIGNPTIFAIESRITRAYASLSLRALGFFVIYVAGERFGLNAPDSTMLACSFEEVGARIRQRGTHTAPFAADISAHDLAEAFCVAVYGDEERITVLGMQVMELQDLIYSRDLLWAPDGDEAFDDRSNIIQLDVDERVRLVAFKRATPCGFSTLREVWLRADEYYTVLQEWYEAFEKEWVLATKTDSSSEID